MKIKREVYGRTEIDDIEEYTRSKLNGADYGQGALEDAARTADNVAEALGRLLEVLASNKVLNAQDIVKVIEGYASSDPEAELVDE